jgi:hypothetical protein
MSEAERTLRFFLPRFATAIGKPATPAAYLRDVISHNVRHARAMVERGKQRPARRMTRAQHLEFRCSLDFAFCAAKLLRSGEVS